MSCLLGNGQRSPGKPAANSQPAAWAPFFRSRAKRLVAPFAGHPFWKQKGGTKGVSLRPASGLAERGGFEPPVHFFERTHDFQSCPFGLSGISPDLYVLPQAARSCPLGQARNSGGAAASFKEQMNGGERGIRTPVGAFGPQIDFESIPLRPLRYLSAVFPPRRLPQLKQSCERRQGVPCRQPRLQNADRAAGQTPSRRSRYHATHPEMRRDHNLFCIKKLLKISAHRSASTPPRDSTK